MTWVAWRQHRAELIAVAALLGVLGAILAVQYWRMTGYARAIGLDSCLRSGGTCGDLQGLFSDRFGPALDMIAYLNLLPLAMGVFWGAPLVARELEQGTQRLAWTQSVPRGRWLAAKLTVLAAGAVLAGAGISVLLGWELKPVDAALGSVRMQPNWFDLQGVAPAGYAVFAFALGTAAGALTRRTLVAMASTAAGFFAVRLGLEGQRWRLLPPLRRVLPADAGSPQRSGDWVLPSSGWIGPRGQLLSDRVLGSLCSNGHLVTRQLFARCMAGHGVRRLELYQPLSRFWTFQLAELGAYLALAAGLLAVTCWLVLRRAS